MRSTSLLSGNTEKRFVRGTQRARTPHETLARIVPLLPRFGITRVANVTGLDHVGIPTVMVTRPNSRSLSVSQGKGLDLDAAKASGILESVEQWHAERIDAPLRFARHSELSRSARTADVRRLPGYVDDFDPERRILWIEGAELTTGEPRWVPYEMVQLDFTLPLPGGSGCFMPGSNGLASGNAPAEAVVHALCELIERDALTLFYQLSWEEQWQRRIEPASIVEPECRELLAAFARADLDVAVWDATNDLSVPVFLCSVLERTRDPFRPVGLARGSGAHLDSAVALARALTEAAQSRLTRIAGTRDDIRDEDFAALRSESRFTRAQAELAAPGPPPGRFARSEASNATFEDDLRQLARRLTASGMPEVVVVDLSRPDLPLSVVRVVVPGLEAPSESPGYRPGARARGAEPGA
jgi:ribosomal protein S12 methylthiotransferase accessory factor